MQCGRVHPTPSVWKPLDTRQKSCVWLRWWFIPLLTVLQPQPTVVGSLAFTCGPSAVQLLRTSSVQVAKGGGCSKYKQKRRSICTHTLIVAIFLLREGGDTTGFWWGGGAGTADGGGSDRAGGPTLAHTPQVLFNDDPESYRSKMRDLVLYLSRHQFPPSFTSSLCRRPVEAAPGTTFRVSQQKCTCGSSFDALGDDDAHLITKVRGRSCVV